MLFPKENIIMIVYGGQIPPPLGQEGTACLS
jgi:hypothetical protein